jgi:hypothetical protein
MVGLLEIAAGPLVVVIGIVSVFFVMRHKRVQDKSMYSARRGQIERKVRAARQRTLAPTSKHSGKEGDAPAEQLFAAPGMEAKTAVPTATWGPPAAGPAPAPPPSVAPEMTWDVGPTAPSAPPPPPPTFAPAPPAYSPPPPTEPAYTPPPPSEPAYAPPPPAPAEEWAPAAVQPVEPFRPEPTVAPMEPASTPAGGGAAWSIVGDSKATSAEPDTGKKKSKKERQSEQAEGAAWQLSSGLMPGEEAGDEIKTPSTALAIAQYAVFGLGLLMVLIGVLVTLANSHVT